MRKQFETKLSSPEGSIDGMANQLNDQGSAWGFKSIDGTIHLVIARDSDGNWMRADGTEPFLSSWTEELVKKVTDHI
ncbi:MAG TPA: hypothetical protein VFE53_12725 [Mucilaginibacter sp.]|jgi:hypothetical protein|nr:hypothetical protein [Mucilaginibacter sp.]